MQFCVEYCCSLGKIKANVVICNIKVAWYLHEQVGNNFFSRNLEPQQNQSEQPPTSCMLFSLETVY